MPGRNTSKSPSSSSSARSTTDATAASTRSLRCLGSQRRSIGWVRPSLMTTGAGPVSVARSRANMAVSAVADIATIRRSGRSVAPTSSVSARPRSVVRLRSWTSSNSTAATPGSSGSCCRRLVSTPSVSTSMRVFGPMARSSRVWYPTRSPGALPVSCAIRLAAARVANRRGSSTMIFPSPRHVASSSASGTTVVLPAPGGALTTARPRPSSAFRRSPRLSRIGRSGSSTMPGSLACVAAGVGFAIDRRLGVGSFCPCRSQCGIAAVTRQHGRCGRGELDETTVGTALANAQVGPRSALRR